MTEPTSASPPVITPNMAAVHYGAGDDYRELAATARTDKERDHYFALASRRYAKGEAALRQTVILAEVA